MSINSKTVLAKGSIVKETILDPSLPSSTLLTKAETLEIALKQRERDGGLLLNKVSRKNCNAGTRDATKYEEVCKEIIETTLQSSFKNHVVSFHSKTLEINGYKQFVRDITFPNNPIDLDKNCIWNILKREFGVRSFVLECKNYLKSKITRDEVYQLYEYLDPNEHGRLGIFLTRLGERSLDDSARSAIVRLKKDSYKLIVLKDDDMVEWINSYITHGGPEHFFNKFIDEKRGWPI